MAVFPPVPSPPVPLADSVCANPVGLAVPVDDEGCVSASPPVGSTAGGVERTVTMMTDGVTTSPGTVGLGVTVLKMIWVDGSREGAVMTEVGASEDDWAGGGDEDGAGVEEGSGVEEAISMGVELAGSDVGGGVAEDEGVNEGVGVADGAGDDEVAAAE